MRTFEQFLKEKEQEVHSEEAARLGELERWTHSVVQLYDQVEAWLKASDHSNLLRFTRKSHEITESQIGTYALERLEMRLGGRVLSLIPVARFVLGPVTKPGIGAWTGRVDLTDGEYRFEIFRFTRSDGPDEWFVRTNKYPMDRFSKEILEEFVMTLLS